MENNKVKVNIFGNTYSIQGDASPEYILKLAEYVNNKMEDVKKSISNSNQVQISILAALNIADEYFQLKEIKASTGSILEQKTKTLISMIDEGIIGDVLGRTDIVKE